VRWLRPLLVTTAVAFLAACGNRHLIVQVDVLSYLDPSQTRVDLGPVPAAPGGIYTGEQEIVKDVEVNLVDGTESVAEVQSVSIAMSVIASDSTGSAQDTLRLYLSDTLIDPLTTPPVIELPIPLTPGVTDTVSIDVTTDSRVTDLFGQKRMRVTLTSALRGPDTGADLNARLDVKAIDAVLVAGRKGDL